MVLNCLTIVIFLNQKLSVMNCKLYKYILNYIQNSFQGVTRNPQNGEPDFEGNFTTLVFSGSMRKTRLWNCLITEDNRERM